MNTEFDPAKTHPEIREHLRSMFDAGVYKIVLSKLRKESDSVYQKINLVLKKDYYQAECYTKTQVFHRKYNAREACIFCAEALDSDYMQLNAWSEEAEYQLMISRKGKAAFREIRSAAAKPAQQISHNREKRYLLEEGQIIPPLIDMGVFSKEGRVLADKHDKFRQINRFVEIIEDELRNYPLAEGRPLKVVDFGCGKSYLTFILYYYLTEIRKLPVNMIGLDLKEDVIAKCNEAANKYGYSSLKFLVGDIGLYKDDVPADMVITLHACDTATDYALYHAITWKARMLFSVPCCQHELNKQFSASELDILGRYGIVKERLSALMTDSIRANLLEYCGYRTQLLEFVDFENTPKNLLIRAVRRKQEDGPKLFQYKESENRVRYLKEVEELMQTFSFRPTLYRLLQEDGLIPGASTNGGQS